MSNQPVFTPEIKTCWCGADVEARRVLADSVFDDGWQVACENDHAYSKKCNSKNRAIHRWNNRMSHDAVLVSTWGKPPAPLVKLDIPSPPMTYAEKFKTKVAEVMPEHIWYFDELHNRHKYQSKQELISFIWKDSNKTIDRESKHYFEGMAETICAVIDHEDLTQVSQRHARVL